MPRSVSERVQKRREALRAAGLRPDQIWEPDTHRPGFIAECLQQAALIAASDRTDADLTELMGAALKDLDEWR